MGALNNYQKQVLLSGILGDGSLIYNGRMDFKSIHKEYLELKNSILGELSSNISKVENKGYKKGFIFRTCSIANTYGKELVTYSLQNIIDNLGDLGLALWFYDDGSLHKDKFFYNLCTHAFTEEEHINILIPYFKKLNIIADLRSETKKDGRKFFYLSIGKHNGAFEISKLLNKYPVKCFSYKRWNHPQYILYKEALRYKEFREMNGHQRPYFLGKLKIVKLKLKSLH